MASARELAQRWVVPFADPRRLLSLLSLPRFFREMHAYRRAAPAERVELGDTFPCLMDRTAKTPFDPHYFYQGAWLARKLAQARPAHHIDVGSSVLTMSVLSGFVPTTFVDYRPLQTSLGGLSLIAGNATQLPFADAGLGSVSCLHVVEHVGLGRYGDPIVPGGTKLAIAELARVIAPGGRLYLTTPVGRERVCFNAHRVSAPESVMAAAEGLDPVSFALVDDSGAFHAACGIERAVGLEYGCGMFEFARPA
jgi:hypothetical protein